MGPSGLKPMPPSGPGGFRPPNPPIPPMPPMPPMPPGLRSWTCLQTISVLWPTQVNRPVTLPKPPVVSGKATVAVLPHSGSPAVVPLHVVVSAAVVAVQVICSPFGFAVVGMNRNGIPPTVAFTGPVAVMAHVLELVFVQAPAAAPTAVQVPPIVVVHPTPGVPETPGAVGTPGVRVDVGVVSVPVGVEV